MGSTFWATRGTMLNAWGADKVTPRERVYASAVAGGISGGSFGVLMRGRTSLVSGTVAFAIFGLLGQSIYNTIDARRTASMSQTGEKENFLQRLAASPWIPMKALSDDDYERMLQEKLLRVNAEIALIDENLERLRHSQNEALPNDSK
ncbi:hypothetical protein B0A49_08943 [Cryomyces minteri]|uniref:Uncharacterized protein n=1 Tax=Cryomyces minteri TaxID=331657 RepID=A0A4U0WLB2_9PEZI|nr:hypothetical protein B0A49_08943 [Cryomyces minteri]